MHLSTLRAGFLGVILLSGLLPRGSSAQESPTPVTFTLPVVAFEQGVGTVEARADGILVTFEAMRGVGLLDCGDDPPCLERHLDGGTVTFRHDLGLWIRREDGQVTGRARGVFQIIIDVLSAGAVAAGERATLKARLLAEVEGLATCVGHGPDPCAAVSISLQETGTVHRWTDHNESDPGMGVVHLTLAGDLMVVNTELKGVMILRDLSGSGTLSFAPLKPAEF